MNWFKNFRKRYKIRREQPQYWDFPELGFGYIQIPKVATRSIRDGLMNAQGISSGYSDFVDFERKFGSHVSHEKIRAASQGKLVFAFVRHPLARLYSAYVDKIINAEREGRRNIFECNRLPFGISFEDFVRRVCAIDDRSIDRHLRSQGWFLSDASGLIPHYIGKLEKFDEDWERLREQLPMLGAVRHLNEASSGSDYLSHYSNEAKDLAVARYAIDLSLFKYATA